MDTLDYVYEIIYQAIQPQMVRTKNVILHLKHKKSGKKQRCNYQATPRLPPEIRANIAYQTCHTEMRG